MKWISLKTPKIWPSLLLFFLIPILSVMAQQAPDAASNPLQQRAYNLYSQLRCPVCQGQSLAESPAELAGDMRALILEQLQAGDDEQTIINFLKDRYGDTILFNPPFSGRTYILWLLPFIILLTGLWVVIRRTQKASSLPDQRQLHE